MTDLPALAAAFAAGALLGGLFFWGLWATVSRLSAGRRRAAWMAAGFVLRFGIALGGFYLIARLGDWTHLLSAALGFALARAVAIHRVRRGSTGTAPGS